MPDFHHGADRIAIGARPAKVQHNGPAIYSPLVTQHSNLRPEAALDDQIEVAISIEVDGSKTARIVWDVRAGNTGEIKEVAASARVQVIFLIAVPVVAFAD